MKFKLLIILILVTLIDLKIANSNNIIIKFKVEDEIITNKDIIDEANYLIILNQNLKDLSKDNIYKISLNSIIKEKIKYIEITKYFNLDSDNKELDKMISQNLNANFRSRNEEELISLLKGANLSLGDIKKKIKIEIMWNKLIYDKYISKISLDKNKLKKKIEVELSNKNLIEEYFIEEILFELREKEILEEKYKEIIKFIDLNNFSNAANKYSISSTSKIGGKIGWIKKTQLSSNIMKKIKKLKINQISNPLPTGNGFLILRVTDKKKTKQEFNIDEELNKLIEIETDRQLNQYSTNFFNKIKKNIFIDEL